MIEWIVSYDPIEVIAGLMRTVAIALSPLALVWLVCVGLYRLLSERGAASGPRPPIES
jgi:hypothetical protein